ncbi:response regulator transcription factor [Actinomadura sp. KC345]|uniref:response regulator n=1 Tax=Actinomadura sp. KC345 TaxID=2530371 RepID=UPI001045C055|nr:response regulator [Actinomadura sp. KC345]TDC48070.1 response regulator transcription factor [Actinomadura sp. KC345]
MRVLIVEDDPGVGRLLRMLLERDGHEAVLAEDGARGWSGLTGPAAPHLLILDLMLPDMDGADLLARVRADHRTATLPVLLITAAARTSGDLEDGTRTRVLAKPFDLADFRSALSALTAH